MKTLEVPDHLVPALERMLTMSTKKKNDYSRVGPWQNFKDTSAFFRLRPWQSAIFNCVQKLSRVQSLSDGRKVANEPLEDTLLDFANYALFAYAMYLDEASEGVTLRPSTSYTPPVRVTPDPCARCIGTSSDPHTCTRNCCGTNPDDPHSDTCETKFMK